MADRIKLVQGDTRPPITVQLTDDSGPIDLSDAGTAIHLKFRAEGSTTILATLTASKLSGYEVDGVLNTASPYDVAGAGGRCLFSWAGSSALVGDPGNYEGEIEITFSDATVQTVYDLLKFKLREQF